MKRMVLIAALLLGTGLSAHADTVTYHNVLKQPRNDDQLHDDGYYCDAQVGPDRNGVPTAAAYKQCMLLALSVRQTRAGAANLDRSGHRIDLPRNPQRLRLRMFEFLARGRWPLNFWPRHGVGAES